MRQSNISTWLKFALQQMVAESYLDQLLFGRSLREILLEGNNDQRFVQPDANGNLPGKTRFTNVLADRFLSTYDIIDHHANDGTGFSATLMRDRTTGAYTLSFRSTESALVAEGGDRERDLFGADAEIGGAGFAFGQLAAMEDYYQSLKTSGTLPAGAVLNVTGYSLGGHLATVFTELHHTEVNHTYIFNGAGRGHVPGEVPGLSAEESRISDMMAYFRLVLDNPDEASDTFPRDSDLYLRAIQLHQTDPQWRPFEQQDSSLYNDPRYLWAKAATLNLFKPTGIDPLFHSPEAVTEGPFGKITQLYGFATTNDLQFVANSGVHAAATPVFIEGQPLIAGAPLPSVTESGNTHSITLIVDSLAVQELIQTIDSRYGQASAELLIKAVSNAKAETTAPLNVSGVTEGDSLEKAVDALRKLFRDPALSPAEPLPVNSRVGGFGDLANRNAMYQAIDEVTQRARLLRAQGVIFSIEDLTAVSAAALAGIADTDTDQGLAYRYALKELNPFAVVADTPQANEALYATHAQGGGLDMFDDITGVGTLTSRYLDDRALFLKEKISLNQLDHQTSTGNIHFKDVTTGYEIVTNAVVSTDRQFIFDSDAGNLVTGNSADDELFGAGGDDLVRGMDGNDYLEGGTGHDHLLGGVGEDILEGGVGHDTIEGGRDNDLLKGGAGLDTYLYHAGDGTDQIEDSDAQGHILFDGALLQGGIRAQDGPSDTYTSLDGAKTYVLTNGHLMVNGLLTVNAGFQSGQFGIRLIDLPNYAAATRDIFTKSVPDPLHPGQTIPVPFFDDGDNDSRSPELNGPLGDDHHRLHALGGNDYVVSGAGDDELYGDEGTDELYGGLGHDRLYGGTGNDTLVGDNSAVSSGGGNDYLDGGDGNDLLQGGAGADILIGGAGIDNLNGDEPSQVNDGNQDDYLFGGANDDSLFGGAGSDILDGGDGHDLLVGDTTSFQGGRPEDGGADFMEGGTGNDQLFGLYGNDVLSGGDGLDLVNGQDGDDLLYGGAGDDVLSGDLRLPSAIGFYDTREYRGAGGDDLLYGGEGRDYLYGGEGDDYLSGGDGNDVLYGDYNRLRFQREDALEAVLMSLAGNDTLHGGEGDDGLFGGAGSDVLNGGEGNDELQDDEGLNAEGSGDDWLYGGNGNDLLTSYWGDDRLFGGSGNDRLISYAGKDELYGEEGDDIFDVRDASRGASETLLVGGTGNDTYLIDSLSDRIVEEADGGIDTVVSNIDFVLSDNLENLTLNADHLVGTGNDQDNVLNATNLVGTTLIGGGGNDTLTGLARLDGGAGNDTMVGGGSVFVGFEGGESRYQSNTYLFDRGYGQDMVVDTDTEAGFSSTQWDVIEMGPDITPGDVEWRREGEDLILSIAGTDDQLTIQSYYKETFDLGAWRFLDGFRPPSGEIVQGSNFHPYYARPGQVELIRFADGTKWGPGLLGGLVTGAYDSNTFEFGYGSGHVRLIDFDELGHGIDTVRMEAGITADDVLVGKQGSDLVFTLKNTNETLTVLAHFDFVLGSNIFTGQRSNPTPYRLERVVFDDGTVWDYTTFESRLTTIIGTDHAEPLVGNANDNVIRGLGGHDALIGRAGNDLLDGGGGDDELEGDEGNDVLMGGTGDDLLFGEQGDDTYIFNRGDGSDYLEDSVQAGAGNRIRFGAGISQDDLTLTMAQGGDTHSVTIAVGASGDSIEIANLRGEDTGVELLEFADGTTMRLADLLGPQATDGDDVLEGGPAAEVIEALAGNDIVDAGAGNDTIAGGQGNDALSGGAGDDTYVFNLGDGVDTITDQALPGEGNQIQFGAGITPADLSLGLGSLLLRVGSGGDAIHLTPFDPANVFGPRAIDRFRLADGTVLTYEDLLARGFDLAGTAGDDTLTGTNTTDRLVGWAGNDVLQSGEGNDLLDGGPGTDRMEGGGGDDTYVVDDAGDVVTESAGEGLDSVQSSVSYSLGANLEHLTLVGAADLAGTGNELDNILIGNSGNNVLEGAAGADRMIGGAGDDRYLVDDAGDVVVEQIDEGIDTVESSVTYTLAANVENLTLAGTAAINGSGNELDNVLAGNSAANVLAGGQGNDTYVIGIGDQVVEQVGEGIDTVQSSLSYQLGAHVENLALTGTANLNGTGNELDNVLVGNSGLNRLTGGAGNDTYVVGRGDTVVEGAGGGIDTIQTHITWTLGSNLENLTLTGSANVNGIGNSLNNILIGNAGANLLDGGSGQDRLDGGEGNDLLLGGSGHDELVGGVGNDALNAGSGHDFLDGGDGTDVLDGGSGDDQLHGGSGDDVLLAGSGADRLSGGIGNDLLIGGSGNDRYLFSRGDGQDTIVEQDPFPFNQDSLEFGPTIAPLDLILSRQADNLRIALYGTSDQVTIQNWYGGTANQTELIQAGNGQQLLNSQVDQLIQAMAGLTSQTGLSWEEAVAQRPEDVQAILAASWS